MGCIGLEPALFQRAQFSDQLWNVRLNAPWLVTLTIGIRGEVTGWILMCFHVNLHPHYLAWWGFFFNMQCCKYNIPRWTIDASTYPCNFDCAYLFFRDGLTDGLLSKLKILTERACVTVDHCCVQRALLHTMDRSHFLPATPATQHSGKSLLQVGGPSKSDEGKAQGASEEGGNCWNWCSQLTQRAYVALWVFSFHVWNRVFRFQPA